MRPQEVTRGLKVSLEALAKAGRAEAATSIREHLASPALAHFSVSELWDIEIASGPKSWKILTASL